MGNQDINYSFSKPGMEPFKEVHSNSIDYAKQAARSISKVECMITDGAMVFILQVSPASSTLEIEPKITFNTQPAPETMQIVYASLQNDVILDEESKRENLKVEVMALAKLEDNWDEEGAQRVSTTAIKNVLNLLDYHSVRIDLIVDIYANTNGTVSVEWENDNHEYAGVQIGRKQMSYYVTRHQGSDYCNLEYINEKNYQKLLTKLAML